MCLRLMRRPRRWIASRARRQCAVTPRARLPDCEALVDCEAAPELFFRAAVPRPLRERRGGLNTPPDRVFTPDEPSTWPLTNRLPRAACRLRAPRAGAVACACVPSPSSHNSVRVICARGDGCASQALCNRGKRVGCPARAGRRDGEEKGRQGQEGPEDPHTEALHDQHRVLLERAVDGNTRDGRSLSTDTDAAADGV